MGGGIHLHCHAHCHAHSHAHCHAQCQAHCHARCYSHSYGLQCVRTAVCAYICMRTAICVQLYAYSCMRTAVHAYSCVRTAVYAYSCVRTAVYAYSCMRTAVRTCRVRMLVFWETGDGGHNSNVPLLLCRTQRHCPVVALMAVADNSSLLECVVPSNYILYFEIYLSLLNNLLFYSSTVTEPVIKTKMYYYVFFTHLFHELVVN